MKSIKTVGVVGAGTMGSALSQKFAQEGFTVILADKAKELIDKGFNNIKTTLHEGLDKRVFTEEQVKNTLNRIQGTINLDDLQVCDLVVEAIFENFHAKTKLFNILSDIVPSDTIIATNTSSFSVSELARTVSNPERFIGVHYFYHAAKNRLVELIPGEHTSQDTYEAMKVFSVQSGKDAITSGDSYGFIVNRYFVPWLNESVRLLEDGVANIATIDDVNRQLLSIGMGPFALMNATGVPVAYHAQKTLEDFGPFYKVSERLKKQTELRQDWTLEGEISQDEKTRKIISDRILAVVFLVSSQLLDDKVCTATDINRGARIGLRWRKGPIELMLINGEDSVRNLMQPLVYKYKMKMPESVGRAFWKMDSLFLEKKGRNAILSITRPEDMNALNESTMQQLHELFLQAESDPGVDNIFIIGSGKAFVAGADIKFFIKNIKANNLANIEKFTAFGQQVYERIDKSPKKVIVMLNGLALGGGLELALCADVILALPKTMMAFPETGIGIYPGLGGTQRSVRRVGKYLSKYLIYTGKMLSARDALEIGLIDGIVSVEEMYAMMNASMPLPEGHKKELSEKWQSIQRFFEQNSLDDLLSGTTSGTALPGEEVSKISRIVQSKAPVALKIADKLIEEQQGCASELKHLADIFATSDALLGLSSIGKKVEFQGK